MRPLGPYEQYLIHEFVEDYQDGLMSRRDMMRRVLHITGGVATAATVLTKLGVKPVSRSAAAQEATPSPVAGPRSPLSVPADDPRVIGEDITFPGDGATIMAYQARPSGQAGATPAAMMEGTPAAGGLPVVLICHENRGLTEHIRDVARRYAVEGYLACAVDLLSREGGTGAIADQSQIPSLLTGDVDPMRHVSDFQAAIEYYRGQEIANIDRLAMTGFCFGGGITWLAATAIPELKAAAPYYGPPPPLDRVPMIRAAVIGIYSDDPDDFANNGRDELQAALEAAGVTFEIKVYPNTQHAFNNDTGPRYNEEASLAAWRDVQAWFRQYV
ncbi:MAG TPA: dienelactone hydrolase family protein [Thermomicrobiales bacterium]